MNYAMILAAIALAGCAQPIVTPHNVDVPVETRCVPPPISEPEWNIPKLHFPVGIYPGVQACLEDVPMHFGYEEELKSAIQGCSTSL